jgi:3',5'-cyclic AMP phosphodiesterase CpdA
MIRIAHISDLHVLDLTGNGPQRYLGKRLTGLANLRLKRGHHHHTRALKRVLEAVKERAPTHVVITGDITNLALESEFRAAHRLIQDVLRMPPDEVSIVPGNHDAYTQGAVRSARFRSFFGAHMTSTRGKVDNHGKGEAQPAFPYLRIIRSAGSEPNDTRSGVALIGLSTAMATMPLRSAGEVGDAQRNELAALLTHPDVRDRTLVLLAHHPIINPPSKLRTFSGGLQDAQDLVALLAKREQTTITLHGHLHKRMLRSVDEGQDTILAIGATSASLESDDQDRRAGYNWYEFSDAGELLHSSAMRLAEDISTALVPTELPV